MNNQPLTQKFLSALAHQENAPETVAEMLTKFQVPAEESSPGSSGNGRWFWNDVPSNGDWSINKLGTMKHVDDYITKRNLWNMWVNKKKQEQWWFKHI